MAALVLALLIVVVVGGYRLALAMKAAYERNNALPEGYTIDTEEHWHEFFQRPYWYCFVLHNGEHVVSGGGSMTTSHGEAMRIGRDLLRIRMKKEAKI